MKNLIPVLESLGIDVAISLDDDYETEFDPARQGILRIDDFLRAYRGYFSDCEISEIEDSGVPSVLAFFQSDSVSSATKKKARNLLAHLKVQQTPPALQFLERGFEGSSIALKKITNLETFPFESLSGAICFIDKEINCHDILSSVIPRMNIDHQGGMATIVVVFTSDINLAELNTSWQKRYEYCTHNLGIEPKTAACLSYSFFIVLKKEIEDKLKKAEEAALKYLSDILIASMSGFCTYYIIQKMRAHSGKAFDRLDKFAKDVNQKTFQNIQYNMLKEGEPNIYHAFKSVFDYMQELEYMGEFEQYRRYIMAMKRLARIPKQDEEEISAQSLKDILKHYEWAQFQFIHNDINKTFTDIARGDVFKLIDANASSYVGVLITQSCDCIIRKGKDHTQRKASRFTLVLFEEKPLSQTDIEKPKDTASDKDKQTWRNRIRNLRNNAIILSCEEGDDAKASYIDVGAPNADIQILPFILDLASLSEEGKAFLLDNENLEQVVNQYKTNNWREYYPILKQEVEQQTEQIHFLIDKLGENADHVVRSLYGISFSQKDNRFCIERIGHFEDNVVELISYNYIMHTYRAGKNSLLSLNSDLKKGEGDT